MQGATSPLDSIIQDVRRALASGVYYSAIAVALTIPEICATLETPGGSSSGQSAAKYKAWYNQWLAHKYQNITDLDCYSLRCGVVHQGRFGHPRSQYARILFTLPNKQNNYFHNNILNDALNLDAVTFCEDIIQSALDWYSAKQNDPNVIANVPLLVQLRPEGLAPYMVGMPLIA